MAPCTHTSGWADAAHSPPLQALPLQWSGEGWRRLKMISHLYHIPLFYVELCHSYFATFLTSILLKFISPAKDFISSSPQHRKRLIFEESEKMTVCWNSWGRRYSSLHHSVAQLLAAPLPTWGRTDWPSLLLITQITVACYILSWVQFPAALHTLPTWKGH